MRIILVKKRVSYKSRLLDGKHWIWLWEDKITIIEIREGRIIC